jgi:putative Mg2+ transporter-C (MgtC) family protein
MMGLCFGGGQLGLGLAMLGLGVFVLWTLKWVEKEFVHERRATIVLTLAKGGPSEGEVRGRLASAGFVVARCAVSQARPGERRTLRCDLRWRTNDGEKHTPAVVEALASSDGVVKTRWMPE